MKTFIGFRLRKELDCDIQSAIDGLDDKSVSELARTGLRLALGIRTQKVVEVREMPVTVKVWTPNKK